MSMKFMKKMLVQLVFLQLLMEAGCANECTPPGTAISSDRYAFVNAHAAGDNPKDYLYIGGLFGIHKAGDSVNSCGAVRERGVHNLEAFLWAIRTFKDRHPGTLEGVQVGALSFDSWSDSFHLLQQFANFKQCLIGYGIPTVDPESVMAYVGPGNNDEGEALARYIRKGPPLISHAATSSSLSNKNLYPHFLRLVPSDTAQVEAIVDILNVKKWMYVQVLYSGDGYGLSGIESFLTTAKNTDICVVNQQKIPLDLNKAKLDELVTSLLENQRTRAVILFANQNASLAVLEAVKRKSARGYFTWFGTTAWATASIGDHVEDVAEGAVTLRMSDTVSLGFREYFNNLQPDQNNGNPWLREYWGDKFQCYFSDIPNVNGYAQLCDDMTKSLGNTALDIYVPYTIQAVDTILLAINRALNDICKTPNKGICAAFLQGNKWQTIFDYIIKQKRNTFNIFNISTGDVQTSNYEVHNFRRDIACNGHCYKTVGKYSTGGDLNLQPANVHVYGVAGDRLYGATSTCSQIPCSVCGEIKMPTTPVSSNVTRQGGQASGSVSKRQSIIQLRTEPWVIPLMVLAGIGILLVIILDITLLTKIFQTSYMKHWRTMWFGQLLLLGILLSYLTLFAFVFTPTNATCAIIRFGVGVSYALCFSVLLVKLLIVLNSESGGSLQGVFQGLLFFFAWGVQIAVDTEWLVLKSPGVTTSQESGNLVCENGNFQTHVLSLVYVMFLIFTCTVLAIKTHNITSNHREGVFIGICAGFTVPIWLVWILIGMLFGGPTFHDPCLAFGLFASATLLLFVMFLPKVRQLNSMGVEGIYAEDDTVDYSASVIKHGQAPASSSISVAPSVIGYAPAKAASEGSVILIPNSESINMKSNHAAGSYALHLRHPNTKRHYNSETASIQSAPLGPTYMVRQPTATKKNIHATTRVLRMTNDLRGRVPSTDRRATSEFNYNATYDAGKTDKENKTPSTDIYRPTLAGSEPGSI